MKRTTFILAALLTVCFIPAGLTLGDDKEANNQLIHITGGKTTSLETAFNEEKEKTRLLLILSLS